MDLQTIVVGLLSGASSSAITIAVIKNDISWLKQWRKEMIDEIDKLWEAIHARH